jgi:acyl-coenzyme A thioesterase PaaI-like protein
VTADLEAVRAHWEAHPRLRGLQVAVVDVARGHACLELTRHATNVAGVRDSINGGVQATLAEVAAHIALETVLAPGERIAATQDFGISYLSSAVALLTRIEARVLRHGRLSVVAVESRPAPTLEGGEEPPLNTIARVTCIVRRDT